MAFVSLIFKAVEIEKLRRELEEEKKKAAEASKGVPAKYTLRQRYRHFWIDLRNSIRRKCSFPRRSCIYRTAYKLKRDGSCENFTLKSIAGFIGGFFLTYIFFTFFVFQLNFKLSTATIMCSIFGSILTLGLAFSYKVRCVVFLLLPQFFSKRGRQALMAYAFILAITGPAKNTLHNMGILSESMACGQEQLKAAVRQIIEVIKKPFYAIRDAIKSVVKTVKVIVKAIKEILLTIKRIVMAILRVVKAAFQFLGKILNICNKELGTPFERCMKVFEDAITDCNAKLGPLFNWLCSITYLVQSVCYVVKIFDFICMIVDFISDSIIGVVIRKVKIFVRHMRTMFYVRIKFSHSFHFETNQSKSISEITTGIVTEIRQRTDTLLTVFDFMSCATSMFFLVIILRALHYRYRFLTNERFDNRFITKDFLELDMKRAQLEKETVLPFNHRERALYISVGSLRLIKSERVKLSKAAAQLGMVTLKLSTHMMADYALYWVLKLIRYHSKFQSSVQAPNVVGLHIEGKGFIANLLKSIVKAFQPLGVRLEIDTVPCLPDPIPPDYDRYIQIASLLVLCLILTIFEPYGLRLRHSVMCYYHPTRARQRAIWLYNHILRSRTSFLKFARRQLRRKITGAKGITKITLKEYLRSHINIRLFRICLGDEGQDACLLCGEVFRESDPIKPIRCAKPGCPGIYCEQCFNDLQNKCTVCLEPIQYGDLSDISEEKDSSEEELVSKKKKKKKKRKLGIFKSLQKWPKRDEDDDDKGNEQLLQHPMNDSDTTDLHSDYETGGSTTDNSYTYQNVKNVTANIQELKPYAFKDLEKQRIPDYAAWEDLTGDEDIDTNMDMRDELPQATFDRHYFSGDSIRTIPEKRSVTDIPGKNATSRRELDEDDTSTLSSVSPEFKNRFKGLKTPISGEPKRGSFFDKFLPRPVKDNQEEISLMSTTNVVSSNSSRVDGPSSTESYYVTSLPETETSFIETCASSERRALVLPRCEKCGKFQYIPKLNLDFSCQSPLKGLSSTTRLSSYLDKFNTNVKYVMIQESAKSTASNNMRDTDAMSPESCVNNNYQVVVSRFDKFVDYGSLQSTPSTRREKDTIPRKPQTIRKQITKFKDIERNRRRQEMMKNRLLTHESVTSNSINSPMSESSSSQTSTSNSEFQRTTVNAAYLSYSHSTDETTFRQRVKNYYVKINNSQPAFQPPVTKVESKFTRFFKRLFGKANVKTNLYSSRDPKLPLIKCENAVYISSPKSTKNSSTIQDSFLATSSRSSSGKYSTENSLNTSSGSSGFSLMGSTESHIRGGVDSKLQDSEYLTTTTATTASRGTQSSSNLGNENTIREITTADSTDSDISDISIFFGDSRPKRIRGGRSPSSERTKGSIDKASKSKISMRLNDNFLADEHTPKYSRQPAERDQDPNNQKQPELINAKSIQKTSATSVKTPPSSPNTMTDNYTSSDISPRYVQNIRGDTYCDSDQYSANRDSCCPCPIKPERYFNTTVLKENYKHSNQPPISPYCTIHRKPTGRPRSANNYFQGRNQRRNESRRSSPQSARCRNRMESPSPDTERQCNCLCRYPSKTIYCNCQSDNMQASNAKGHPSEQQDREYCACCNCRGHFQSDGSYTNEPQENQCQNPCCNCNRYEISDPGTYQKKCMDDEVSCSGYPGPSEFPELVYQNTDEFLDLVNELGDTLSLRNKARVEKTIKEFETLSSQNRNLEKPIFEEEENAQQSRNQCQCCCLCKHCIGEKANNSQTCKTKFTRFDANKEGSTSQPQFQNYRENTMYADNKKKTCCKCQTNTGRWQMDPRNGRWSKINDNYIYEEDNGSPSPNRQACMCEKRRNFNSSPDRHERCCTNQSPNIRCNNCGLLRETRY